MKQNNEVSTQLKVHVGFGFHVNCYHSYRGDTPDKYGFGGDIRIIRHIIETLDNWNKKGVAVKGTWDFENAYSIEKILPKYAPDIIENVKRRQNENGDENILMGYNNGAMSAMTEKEFLASINMAITNDKKSGLKDVFGDCEMIIRPQEVMFTPAQTSLYRKAGVKALCLYYSCVPFDAFRTLIPQLDDEKAFNPLTYVYKDDDIIIMPTYSQSDLMDCGGLRKLVTSLHQKQINQEINNDVFIFINMDADSFLWEKLSLPNFITKRPNMGGLNGLIEEVYDLDYVTFNTVGKYLNNHQPLEKITFGQDTADGNFNGYSSWAEKPFNRKIWTRIERARTVARVNKEKESKETFENRIRLLSTTHFGLASPVLNITREKSALSLSENLITTKEESNKKDLTLKSHKPQKIFAAQLAIEQGFCNDISKLKINIDGAKSVAAIPMYYHDDGSVKSIFLICKFNKKIKECQVKFSFIENERSENIIPLNSFGTSNLKLEQDEKTGFPVFTNHKDMEIKTEGYIIYKNKKVRFEKPNVKNIQIGKSGNGWSFYGDIHLPKEQAAGFYRYNFFMIEGIDLLFLDSEIQYPYTTETDQISSQASNLGRYSDNKWIEVSPFAFTLKTNENTNIVKRDFTGNMSAYSVSDFGKAFKENECVDVFNHQLTGGILCVGDNKNSFAIAHSRNVLGSMAHCPMRLRKHDEVKYLSMNPFGTYFGKQRYFPTKSNGVVVELYNATMPQAQSLAPAYNGAYEHSIQALSFVEGELSGETKEFLEAIADGVIVEGGTHIHAFNEDNVQCNNGKIMNEKPKHLSMTSGRKNIFKLIGLAIKYLKYNK